MAWSVLLGIPPQPPEFIQPPVGALLAVCNAPAVSFTVPLVIAPGVAQIVASGNAPTVNGLAPVAIIVSAVQAILSGNKPVVSRSLPSVNITIGAGAMLLTPIAPSTFVGSKSKAALLAYLNGLPNGTSNRVLSGTHLNYFDSNPLDQMTGSTIANMTVTTTGLCPAMVGISLGMSTPTSDNPGWVSYANQQLAANGIVLVNHWMQNPQTGGQENDTTDPFPSILTPGSNNYNVLMSYLATLASNLKQINGPVLFRPFLENNGNWFWWGAQNASASQFIALWQLMWNTLINAGVTNCLFVYSPNVGQGNYTQYYPGAQYVDVVSLDYYGYTSVSQCASDVLSPYNTMLTLGHPFIFAESGPQTSPGTGDVSLLPQAIRSTLTQAVGWCNWCQSTGWNASGTTGQVAAMEDQWSIVRTELPAGI